MEEGSDSSTDSNSDWVNVHRSPNASTATEESSVDRSSLSSTEGVDDKVNEPAIDNNPNQQSIVGRFWSSVPSWSSMASRLGGNAADQPAGDSDFEFLNLAGDSEEKKVSGRKKGKSSTTLLKFVKGKWKSEDAVEDNEKRLMQDDDDASVVETVLKENTELQKKNTRLLKKLSDNEKTIKRDTFQLQKNKEEIKRLKKIIDKPRTAPFKVQAQQSSHQRLADEKVALENEVGRLNQESSKLRESLDQVTHCNSGYEARIKEIRKQAEQVEVKYQVEREEKERLNSQVKHLQEQFKSLLARDEKGEVQSSDDNLHSDAVIGRLQGRIKQLNEDLTSLREHSKTQSRQIIVLRQKAELTKHLEEQVASIDSLLIEIEGERDDLKRKLIHITATDDETDVAERHFKTVQLNPEDADAVDLKRKNAQLTSEKIQLEQDLASKVKDVQALKLELEKMIKEKKELQDQVEALQLQVMAYKADFEEERRDREAAHSKMADMEKTIARLEGRSGHEKAELEFELDELSRDKATVKEVLQQRNDELESVTKELEKHKQIVHDLETVHKRHVQEAGKQIQELTRQVQDADTQIQELTSQVSQTKSEQQAKVSQVKQYSKENEKVKGKNEQLKLQLSTAMTSLGVMAEEMEKDRRKAFELQGKLDKFKKGATAKGKRVYIPGACEATEKRVAKLEELYNTAMIDVQSLTVEKEELTKQVGELLREKRVGPLQHGSSQATTPAMTKLNQMQLIPSASSQQKGATCEQPLRAGPTDDIISDDAGTAGAGNFLPGRAIPPSQQLPLRARAPDGPPQGDPDKQSTQTKANSRGMRLPLKSKQEATGTGNKQSFSPQRQRPFSPKHTAKNPPTVKASGASAYGDVSPMRNSGPYQSLGGSPSSITNPPNSDARRILTPHKSAPLLQFNTPHNLDDGERFLSGGIPSPTYNAEQASGITQRPSQEHLVLGNTDQSNLDRIGGPFKRAPLPSPAVPEVVTTPPSGPPDGYPQPTTPVSPGSDSSQVLTKPDRQDHVQSQPSSLPQYDPLKDNSPSPSRKPYTHPREKVTMSPSVQIPDKVTTPSASEMKPTSDDEGQEDDQEQLNRSANQFENPLQRKLDDEIHEHAVKVMREVSGKRLEESGDESGRPFDPNLICPMCMKKFRIGEIQYFKRHVNTCDGTDGDDWA